MDEVHNHVQVQSNIEKFINLALQWNPNVKLIKGVVCEVRVEDVEDPMMQKLRQVDEMIDELAKGKAMTKILRAYVKFNDYISMKS